MPERLQRSHAKAWAEGVAALRGVSREHAGAARKTGQCMLISTADFAT